MNNLRELRTRLDDWRRRGPGRELIRTATDAGTGIYGSDGRGTEELGFHRVEFLASQ